MDPILMNTPLCNPDGVPGHLVTNAPPLPVLIEPTDQPLASTDNGDGIMSVVGARVNSLPAYYEHGLPHSTLFVLARDEVVARLHQAAALLPARFGLTVLDAWRPLPLQHLLYEAAYSDPALPPGFVTPPSSDPSTPPPHLTGGTADVTLSWHGQPLALGTGYDEFTPNAHTAAFETAGDTFIRDLRRLLVSVMRSVGFVAYRDEWWHFEYGTRRWAAITGNAPLYQAAMHPVLGSGLLSPHPVALTPQAASIASGGAVWDLLGPAIR